MKAGILGTGEVARIHVKALRRLGIEIAAVVNHHPGRAEAFAREYDIPVFSDDIGVFGDPQILAVHICTPPMTHGPMILALMEMGKHILTEKPFTVTDEEAAAIHRLTREYPGVYAVNFNLRFYQAVREARAFIKAGDLGPLRLVHGVYLQSFHILPAPYGWRYEPDLAGPMRAVTEIGSHWLDLAQHLTGERIVKVSARLKSFNPLRTLKEGVMFPEDADHGEGPSLHVTSEDAAVLQMIFEKGALGSVVLSEVSHGHDNDLAMEITGDKGTLSWDSRKPHRLRLARRDAGEAFTFTDDFQSTFETHFKGFYEAISMGDQNFVPGFREGLSITRLANALLRSSEAEGEWVDVQ